MAKFSSWGTMRMFAVPMPAMRNPFSMLLCACDVQYAISFDVSPSAFTRPPVRFQRAARIDDNVASLAEP